MKLCIPTLDDRGLQSRLCQHFGSAPWFTILDTETEETESVRNDDAHHQHGTCSPLRLLKGRELDGLVVGGVGRGALAALESRGIGVYRATETTVARILSESRAQPLVRVEPGAACGGRGRGEGSGHRRHRARGGDGCAR